MSPDGWAGETRVIDIVRPVTDHDERRGTMAPTLGTHHTGSENA